MKLLKTLKQHCYGPFSTPIQRRSNPMFWLFTYPLIRSCRICFYGILHYTRWAFHSCHWRCCWRVCCCCCCSGYQNSASSCPPFWVRLIRKLWNFSLSVKPSNLWFSPSRLSYVHFSVSVFKFIMIFFVVGSFWGNFTIFNPF